MGFLYIIGVLCVMFIDASAGISEWSYRAAQCKQIKLAPQFAWLQGIVNAVIYAGYAVWYSLTCDGWKTFVVAATFPISVPLIAFYFFIIEDIRRV